MTRPVLLDLFCGAGGAAMGYHQAGFDVIGVDIKPQPRYPFRFVQGDAFDVLAGWDLMPRFSAVHASPPCQDHSQARNATGREHGTGWMLDATRRALVKTGRPWVIENVSGAPMPGALTLCGTEFGLAVKCRDGKRRELRRHRQFESSVLLMGAGGCCHNLPAISVFGNGGPRVVPRPGAAYEGSAQERRVVMGIDWMNRDETSQAIPPAFTEFIGEQLLAQLAEEAS